MLSFPQGMNFLCTLLMDLFHGDLQLKNLRKVTRELGENITDEQLEAMIDECRPLKLLEYCPLFYQYYCYTRSNQGSVLWQIQAQITVRREKNLLMTDNWSLFVCAVDKDGDGASKGSKFSHSAFTYTSLNLPLICFFMLLPPTVSGRTKKIFPSLQAPTSCPQFATKSVPDATFFFFFLQSANSSSSTSWRKLMQMTRVSSAVTQNTACQWAEGLLCDDILWRRMEI